MSTVKINQLMSRFDLEPSTFDEENRTIDVIFSTGSGVVRGGFFTEPFIEELSLNPEDVDLSRLNNSAPVLRDHVASTESHIGVVMSASVDGEKGVATLKFSAREDVQPILQDIRDGIVKHVSVGYRVNKLEEVGEEDGLPVMRATDWMPMEISLVPIGADDRAVLRSEQATTNDCEIIFRNEGVKKMDQDKNPATEAQQEVRESVVVETRSAEPQVDVESVRKEAAENGVLAERKRSSEIRKACEAAGLESSYADELIEKGVKIDAARKAIIEKFSESKEEEVVQNIRVEAGEQNERDSMREGMENALLVRGHGHKYELNDNGKRFYHKSMVELAATCLRAQGVDTEYMSKSQIADTVLRSSHSTSDFPLITENVLNKSLRDSYNESPQTFRPFVRMRTVADFKEISVTQFGEAPKLELLHEDSEIKHGTITESAEKYQLESYAKAVKVTRKLIINDDLSALTRVPAAMGRQAANLESDLFWGLIINNQVMADGNPLFDAAHNNEGTAGNISITTMSELRALMREQKGLDGETHLGLFPSYMCVASADETLAEQFITVAQGQVHSPDASTNKNPFVNRLQLIVEPRLTVSAGTQPWYMFSDLGQVDMAEMATLAGQQGPTVSSYMDNSTKGITYDILYDVAFKVIDFRPWTRNPGV